jgi:uncharacterized protein (DUF1330 family)
MKRIARLVAAGAALLSVGASAGQGAPPKAYMIAQLTVRDTKAYGEYAPKVPPVIAKYGGHYLVRAGAITPLEGTPPGQRIVVIEFASVEAAKAFYNSADYQALAPLRHAAADGPVYIAEGAPSPAS